MSTPVSSLPVVLLLLRWLSRIPFYVQAYMEETKLEGVHPGFRAGTTPLGSNRVLKGTRESVAAGVTNASSSNDSKGMATIDSNL